MPEAQLHATPSGLAPAGDGWFAVNARDAWCGTSEGLGFACMFERWDTPFPQLGIRLTVLEPGQARRRVPLGVAAGRVHLAVG